MKKGRKEQPSENEQPVIFIVEDNELYSLSLDFGLSHQGNYRIVTFKSGEECIANLHQNPAVIILDYYLDGMNGKEALKEIKRINPEIPVIIMSNQNDVQIAVDLLKEGAYDYIAKSNYATIKLNSAIQHLLTVKEKSQENITLKLAVNKYRILSWVLLFVIIAFIIFIIAMSSP